MSGYENRSRRRSFTANTRADVDLPRFPGGQKVPRSEDWQVWVASPPRFRNPFKLWLRDDVGDLEWRPGQMRVVGWRTHEWSGVTGLALARQTTPWLAFCLSNLLINLFQYWVAGPTKWIRVDFSPTPGTNESVYITDGVWFGWRKLFGGTDRLYGLLREGVLAGEIGNRSGNR
jgi:hypothetical protein